MDFFTKEDQKKIRNRTKRVKKIISSNPIAPKVDKKTKRLLVIIRKCGESTAETCKRLLCNQLSEKDRVIFCEDKPFYKTLIKSYEIAINLQFKWTLLIDADVLPSSIAIFELLKEARRKALDAQKNVNKKRI